MCGRQNKETSALFTRDADARRLWEAGFPDPRACDKVVSETLDRIHELEEQKDSPDAD